ncbi:MAG: hypothetical protein M5R36_00615 [Deltaproteobacteria bacterium]|nr:hypothetical protein [Deltaproteobacteria bacterium]
MEAPAAVIEAGTVIPLRMLPRTTRSPDGSSTAASAGGTPSATARHAANSAAARTAPTTMRNATRALDGRLRVGFFLAFFPAKSAAV